MYANRGNAEFMEGNTMASVHGADVKDNRANHTTLEAKKGAYGIRRILGGRYKKGKGETSGNPSEERGCIRLDTSGELGCASIRYGTPVESVLSEHRGRNMEVYLEEMVIKSKSEQDLIEDVEETLYKLQRVNMKLDPNECAFRMEEGNFLGYVVTTEGIKADPKK
ncbi:hypothetical protein Tco_1249085 [Tanacetum coccineum]